MNFHDGKFLREAQSRVTILEDDGMPVMAMLYDDAMDLVRRCTMIWDNEHYRKLDGYEKRDEKIENLKLEKKDLREVINNLQIQRSGWFWVAVLSNIAWLTRSLGWW